MKSFNYLFILFALLCIIVSSGEVKGVDCGSVPSDGCTLSSNTIYTFVPNNYTFYGNGTNGAITIAGSNITLNCNYSTIIGNSTNTSINTYAIKGYNARDNVTIKNCIISGNYTSGIVLTNTWTNIKILNNILLGNFSNSGIYSDRTVGVIFSNNIFNSTDGNTPLSFQDLFNAGGYHNISNNLFLSIKNSYYINGVMRYCNIINNTFYAPITNQIRMMSGGNNNTVENNTFNTFSQSSINMLNTSNNVYRGNIFYGTNTNFKFGILQSDIFSVNTLVVNNIFNSKDGIDCQNYCIIQNNLFNNSNSSAYASIYSNWGNNNSIFNYNNFTNTATGIIIKGNKNVIVNSNQLYNNTQIAMFTVEGLSNNISFNNNIFNLSDTAISVKNSSNINLSNNTADLMYTYTDGWGNGYRIEYLVYNLSILGNTVTNSAGAPLLLRGVNGSIVANNNFDNMPMTSRNPLGKNLPEPSYSSCISIVELYLGFTGDSTESVNDNITKIGSNKYASSNILLSNNTCGSNTQLQLSTQGTTNITTDISNYYLRELNFNTNLSDSFKYYIKNSVTQLMCEYSNYANRTIGVPLTRNYCVFAYPWNLYGTNYTSLLSRYIQFGISPNEINITNYFSTNLNNSIISALSYYPYNDVKNTSSNTILSSNVDNYSISLSPNQQIEVGNFTTLSISIPTYPSGNILTSNVVIVSNVSDPDSIFNFTRSVIYDENLNIVKSKDNTSLNSYFNFTGLTNQSSYYFRVFVYTDYGTFFSSTLSYFRMGDTYGSGTCRGSEHDLWLLIPLILLAGFLLWLWTAVEGGFFKDISFLVTLIILIQLIINLITTVKLSC